MEIETLSGQPDELTVVWGGLEGPDSKILIDGNQYEVVKESIQVLFGCALTGERMPVVATSSINLAEAVWMQLSLLPEVELVYGIREGNVLHVVSVINELDDAVEDRICDMEELIIDKFDSFDFDFNLVVRGNREMEEILSMRYFTFRYERSLS